MLSKNEQMVLLELLIHRKMKLREIANTIPFRSKSDCWNSLRRMKRYNLIDGSAFWKLTFKGSLRARLISLDSNNPKDYTRNLKVEIIEFEFDPR